MRYHSTDISEAKAIFLIAILAIISILFRFSPQPETKNLQNLDASLHALFTIQAASEAPISIRKFMPITTLGAAINKNISWGGSKFESNGDGIYTSFPPLGFVAPYLFIKTFNFPITLNSLYIFNVTLQGIVAILAFYLTRSIALNLQSTKSHAHACGVVATLPYLFSTEALYSFGYVYWGHCLFQVLFIAYLILIKKSVTSLNTSITTRAAFFFLTLMCLTEWSGYLVAVAMPLAAHFLQNLPKSRKRELYLLSFGAATLAGVILISAFSLTVGLDTMISALHNRFVARNFNAPTTTMELLWAYISSFNFALLLIPVGIAVLIKSIKDLNYSVVFFLLTLVFAAMAENILMKQHATEYHYDRLKTLAIFTILAPVIWSVCHWGSKLVSTAVLIAASSISLFNYSTDRFFPDIDVISNNKYQALNMDDGLIATSHQVRGFLPLMFHRNIMEAISFSEAKSLAEKKAVSVYWIDGVDLSNLIIQIKGIYRFDKDGTIQHFSTLTCSERLQNLVAMTVAGCEQDEQLNRRKLISRQVLLDRLDLQSDELQPHDFTDATWKDGIGRPPLPAVFFVVNNQFTRDVYLSSATQLDVYFAEGARRKIIQTLEAGDFLNIYLTGPTLDPAATEKPNRIKLEKTSTSSPP